VAQPCGDTPRGNTRSRHSITGWRAANGYRTYPAVDVARLLRAQHSQLLTRIERLQAVAATVAKTLAAHEMGINLTPAEMLEVFGEHDPTGHVEEAKQRWGDTDGYREAHRRTSSYGKEQWLQIRREGDEIPAQFAAAMQAGHPADSPEAALYR
jgi:hypothetical protein